jgi:hypothetical protein
MYSVDSTAGQISKESVYIGACSGSYVCNGRGNTAVGSRSQFSTVNSSATNVTANTSLGYCSLANLSLGSFNTAIGGCTISGGLFSGSNNVALGYCSGSDALCTLSTESNYVILGNNTTSCLISKVPLTVPSDLRWKKVAGDVPLALPFVESLNPIKYQFCDAETGEVTDDRYRYGFSAQEILANEEIPDHPIIVGIDNPDMYSVSETMLFPVLVNAIKELSAEVKSLKAEVAALKNA